MKFSDISIRWKILAIALSGPVIVAAILAWQRVSDIRESATNNLVDKSKAIVLMAEATRDQMAKKIELGLVKPLAELPSDLVVQAVPIVTAMQTAGMNAEKAGYTFRVPKVSPRNPANTPTAEELDYLKQLETGNLEDLVVIKKDEIRYVKPIKLTQDCLYCHGEPRGQKDPTGGTMEGWRVGETHGAFEIISSLSAVNAQVREARLTVLAWTVGVLAVIAGLIWFLLESNIIRPLSNASRYLSIIADGDMTASIEPAGNDEVGQIIRNIDYLSVKFKEIVSSISASSDSLGDSAERFGEFATGIIENTQNLNARSASVAAAAEEMSSNMNSVAAATEQAATNITHVATATEDMAETIKEIAHNTDNTKIITSKAVSQSENASRRVDELGLAATKIGKVTEAITEISEQTNLLALNATIEAARAGEAGKGFAVVANEIKDLARQTAEATREIKNHIDGIQSRTEATVTEIQEIARVIREINDNVEIVAAAVEKQNITTREISENIVQATVGIQEVTENVSQCSTVSNEVASDISKVSSESSKISEQTTILAEQAMELKDLSELLKELIASFKM